MRVVLVAGWPLTVMVAVPPGPAFKVRTFEFRPFVMTMVWPAVGPAPEKVPIAVAAEALVFRLNTFPFTPLVMVIVGSVIDVGDPETTPMELAGVPLLVRVIPFTVTELPSAGVPEAVPTTVDAVALVFRVSVFPLTLFATVIALAVVGGVKNVPVCVPGVDWLAVRTSVPPIVNCAPVAGLPEKVPDAVAAAGEPAVKATFVPVLIVSVEGLPEAGVPAMLLALGVAKVSVKAAAVPPTFMLQSRLSGV